MEGRYIPAIITLIAGLVTSVVCLVKGIGTIRSLVVLLIVLIIFYLVGRIVKFVIVKTLQEPFDIPEVEDEEVIETGEEETLESNEI